LAEKKIIIWVVSPKIDENRRKYVAIITLGFKKYANFFAEHWRKSPKKLFITLTQEANTIATATAMTQQ
jgi:hypothetical protein